MRIISGKFRGKKLATPIHPGTRPTSDRLRETIFNILLHNPAFGVRVLLNKNVLDVFAGTGALGLEAFSRGARSVIFVENEREALSLLCENVKTFNLAPSSIIGQDARDLRAVEGPFDLIFLDPPYHKELIVPTLLHFSTQGFFSKEAVVVIEMAKDESIVLPSFLNLVIERTSGAAKVLFCNSIG